MADEKILDSLRRLCSRRECCTAELRLKIRAKGAEDEEGIIRSLVSDGYLSDMRYATAFARDKSSLDGWGATKISYALRSKGIDAATIAAALESTDSDAARLRLRKLMEAKYRMLREDPQCRLKLIRYALGRGYSWDEVVGIADELRSGN